MSKETKARISDEELEHIYHEAMLAAKKAVIEVIERELKSRLEERIGRFLTEKEFQEHGCTIVAEDLSVTYTCKGRRILSYEINLSTADVLKLW